MDGDLEGLDPAALTAEFSRARERVQAASAANDPAAKAAAVARLKLVKAAHGLNAAAAKGDVGLVASAAQTLGGTCKGCHDKFRDEKH